MRSFGFLILLSFTVSALIVSKSNSIADCRGAAAVINNRKLKERSYDACRDVGSINKEDYPRSDPSPNSKAAISSGPIEHGTPLMPYVPRATPPAHPRHGSPP
ncbi:uncharacterized protein LOC109820421 isoform X2 [Asparagus officinalis]|uniref:uncharacterized protein LOC109820421 isoform X2 n=1 Tax=Asparagus officinalis TaxID=4686 RepID=UPI00098E76D9|nr:uncharacterized protein LOC109820421 isoform X2 [Asparagus officinalis]